MLRGSPLGQKMVCSMHHSYSSSVSSFQAKTGMPAAAMAAAAWSWVEKMLQLDQRTSAPSSGFDQNGGLDGHVEATGDARSLERFRLAVFFAEGHEAGHFILGEIDFLASPIGKFDVFDFVGEGTDGGHSSNS